MYALIGSFVAKVAPQVLPPAARPPSAARPAAGDSVADALPALDQGMLSNLRRQAQNLEGVLVPVIGFLWRNQTVQALLASHAVMQSLGWATMDDEQFVAAIPDGYGQCWNQVALLRARPHVNDSQTGELISSSTHRQGQGLTCTALS
jgi:hypothetical protein